MCTQCYRNTQPDHLPVQVCWSVCSVCLVLQKHTSRSPTCTCVLVSVQCVARVTETHITVTYLYMSVCQFAVYNQCYRSIQSGQWSPEYSLGHWTDSLPRHTGQRLEWTTHKKTNQLTSKKVMADVHVMTIDTSCNQMRQISFG